MFVCLTEDETIKPLIICGGCSFTHAPDSWAQVLGNYKKMWQDSPNHNHRTWIKYGKEVAGVDMSNIPTDIYEVWDEGEDITQYADVMVVGQGAAGNQLNSRIIRNVIEQNAGRKILVLWQLSGWNRKEYALNHLDTLEYKEIIHDPASLHATSILNPVRLRNCSHIDGFEHRHVPQDSFRFHEENDPEDAPEVTPRHYRKDRRAWLKQGGTYSGWEDSILYENFKFDSLNLDSMDNQAIRNLETIEYMKLFCESRNVELLTFPGWYWTWDGQFNFDSYDKTLFSKEIFGRLGMDSVNNINGFGGIAEWGLQSEIYSLENAQNKNPKIQLSSGYYFTANETSSIYEKAYVDGEWWCGNHPSSYNHAKFCNDWLKPEVLKLLDKTTN